MTVEVFDSENDLTLCVMTGIVDATEEQAHGLFIDIII